MKKNNKKERLNSQEWAEMAARLSGEYSDSASAGNISDMEKELQKQWNDIKMAYRADDTDTEKAWMKVSKRIAGESEKKKVFLKPDLSFLLKVAASLIIVAGLGWAGLHLTSFRQITVATNTTEKKVDVTLPDGSAICLNRNSSITYPAKFGSRNRKVKLEGEAFFNVTRDASRPFVIDAGNASIKVLGTSFNVITNNGNNETEVLVATGSVEVTSSSRDRSVTLKPGYIGKVSDKTNAVMLNSNPNYLSWKTEKLIYNGQPLSIVLSDLKHAYGISVEAKDPAIYDLTITSSFEEQPHDTIIKVICTTFNLKYTKDSGKYILMKK